MVASFPGAVFRDRRHAGDVLANLLVERGQRGRADLVLGIPRGGVVVASVVADTLGCPLDVALARKVGAPGNPELAVGAVGPDGSAVVEERVARRLGAAGEWLQRAVAAEAEEVRRRLERFRSGRPPLDVSGRNVIVVDDGVATGSTAAAVGQWLVHAGAASTLLAVPVGPASARERLVPPYDALEAVALVEGFRSVGEHYSDFGQTSDEEVLELLQQSPGQSPGP
jgi:putative phosphoribosyl transferase